MTYEKVLSRSNMGRVLTSNIKEQKKINKINKNDKKSKIKSYNPPNSLILFNR